MQRDIDLVESLLRSAGRRIEPPEGAYEQVFAAAQAAFRGSRPAGGNAVACSGRRRARPSWSASRYACGCTLPAPGGELARIERISGGVEVATGDAWLPSPDAGAMGAGRRMRTLDDGRAAFALAGGESLRLAAATEVMLDAPGRTVPAVRHPLRRQRRAARGGAPRGRDAGRDGARHRHAVRAEGRRLGAAPAGARGHGGARSRRPHADRAGGRTGLHRRPGRHHALTHRTGRSGLAMGGVDRPDAGHGRQAGRDADRLGRARDRAPAALRVGARRTACVCRDPARERAAPGRRWRRWKSCSRPPT